MIEANDKNYDLYWKGTQNRIIRYYFYVNRGLSLLNEARYLVMAVLAIYAILKLDHWIYIPLMFFGALPVLGVLGYISVHFMAKVMDFLTVRFGTHYQKYSVDLQEKTLEALNKLNERL